VLLEDMLQHIPHASLLQRPELNQGKASTTQRPFNFAGLFFKIQDESYPLPDLLSVSTNPFSSSFECLVSLSVTYSTRIIKNPQTASVLREPLCRILALIDGLVGRLVAPIKVSWKPSVWLEALLSTFDEVRRIFKSLP